MVHTLEFINRITLKEQTKYGFFKLYVTHQVRTEKKTSALSRQKIRIYIDCFFNDCRNVWERLISIDFNHELSDKDEDDVE